MRRRWIVSLPLDSTLTAAPVHSTSSASAGKAPLCLAVQVYSSKRRVCLMRTLATSATPRYSLLTGFFEGSKACRTLAEADEHGAHHPGRLRLDRRPPQPVDEEAPRLSDSGGLLCISPVDANVC